jgi:tetratricopeptide (TPR) repeat protein
MNRQTYKFNKSSALIKCLVLCSILVTFLWVSGCSTTNHLREAQDAFNKAAALDNQLRVDPLSLDQKDETLLTMGMNKNNLYASVINSLNKLAESDIQQYKTDKLWGNVLALKAMAQWRLGDFDSARKTAGEAKELESQLHPRDRALIRSLPGLIKIDEAFSKIYLNPGQLPEGKTKSQNFKEIKQLLESGVDDIEKVRAIVNRDHPVQSYLLQSQLAAYVNLIQAYTHWHETLYATPTPDEKKKARDQFCDLQRLLKSEKQTFVLDEKKLDQVLLNWIGRMGLVSPDCTND